MNETNNEEYVDNTLYAEVEVEDEQIIVHPTAIKEEEDDFWSVGVRISGTVVIDGKKYEFHHVLDVDLEEVRHDRT